MIQRPSDAPGTSADALVAGSAVAALIGGALSSGQSRANGELSHLVGSPVAAALWSFGSGWLVLCVAVLAARGMRDSLGRVRQGLRSGTLPRWQLLGGLIGGCFVAAQAYAVPRLGLALFTVAVVGGQTVSALVVDRLGIGPGGPRPVSAARVGAAALAFAGIAVAAAARAGTAGRFVVAPVLIVIVAGAGLALQGAMNGRVNAVGKNALATSWINFGWGTALLVALGGLGALRGSLRVAWEARPPWWALVGGVLGVSFVAIGTAVIGRLGVLVMTLLALTGQLVSAVVLDLLSPTAGTRIGAQLVAGVVVTLVGAAIAALSANPRRPARVGEP